MSSKKISPSVLMMPRNLSRLPIFVTLFSPHLLKKPTSTFQRALLKNRHRDRSSRFFPSSVATRTSSSPFLSLRDLTLIPSTMRLRSLRKKPPVLGYSWTHKQKNAVSRSPRMISLRLLMHRLARRTRSPPKFYRLYSSKVSSLASLAMYAVIRLSSQLFVMLLRRILRATLSMTSWSSSRNSRICRRKNLLTQSKYSHFKANTGVARKPAAPVFVTL